MITTEKFLIHTKFALVRHMLGRVSTPRSQLAKQWVCVLALLLPGSFIVLALLWFCRRFRVDFDFCAHVSATPRYGVDSCNGFRNVLASAAGPADVVASAGIVREVAV